MIKENRIKIKQIQLIFVASFLVLFSLNLHSQSYYYFKEKKELSYTTEKLVVYFNRNITRDTIAEILYKYSLSSTSNKNEPEDITAPQIFITTDNISIEDFLLKLKSLNKESCIVGAYPFFKNKNNILHGLTNEFLVKLKSWSDFPLIEKICTSTKTVIVEHEPFDKLVYKIRVNKKSMGDAMEMANFFFETGNFVFTDPVFIILGIFDTNDEFYADQWAIENTGQYNGNPGDDIDVPEAWSYTTGNSDIKVAVIDVGVDLDHPDLINNILPGYDAMNNCPGGNALENSYHGTACAGIIAASSNNTIGIAGICPECKILPIRIIFDQFHMGITNDGIARGFDWAVQNGAKIISNSYGGFAESAVVTDAINNALNAGCVVLFSAGNSDNNFVNYPSYLPGVIAVGASTMCNERCSSTSCNQESWWGSNYGIELDVVAPGTKVATTDIAGPNGQSFLDPSHCYNDDYIKFFGGTSAACPTAAGVVGLMLSANCQLSNIEAKRILELSCSKNGSYDYSPTLCHPNGTWNQEMGHGVVNALRAVKYSLSIPINSYTTYGGNEVESTDFQNLTILFGGCLGMASGAYYAKRYKIQKDISYPQTYLPVLIANSSGLSTANPNPANGYAEIVSMNETGATLVTYVYKTYNILGQYLGWIPSSPDQIRWDYSIFSQIEYDLYLQNRSEIGTMQYKAMQNIIAGNDVTPNMPQGDYIITSDAQVEFYSGNMIQLEPGFKVDKNAFFWGHVGQLITCEDEDIGPGVNENESTEYTSSKTFNNYLNHYEANDSVVDKENIGGSISMVVCPNPFSSSFNLAIQSLDNLQIDIDLYSAYGKELSNYSKIVNIESERIDIEFDGALLEKGLYILVIRTKDYIFTKKIIRF